MDHNYWNDFYSKDNKDIKEHSLFAEYVMSFLGHGDKLLEIGCGNGRDSRWFADNSLDVVCIDSSNVATEKLRELNSKIKEIICGDFVDAGLYNPDSYDVVYSRFSIHAIDDEQEKELIKNIYRGLKVGGIFAIEVRSVNDELFGKGVQVGRNAYIYDNHYRRFIEFDELIRELKSEGFEILYSEENRGFAPFDGQDPFIIRIIAKK